MNSNGLLCSLRLKPREGFNLKGLHLFKGVPLPVTEEEVVDGPFGARTVGSTDRTAVRKATEVAVASMAKAEGPSDLHGENNDGSSQVGGHLCAFAQHWDELTQEGFVLRTIS